MRRTKIKINKADFPTILHPFLEGACVFDSSCSVEARVFYIDKGEGFYLKKASAGTLKAEAEMTEYFNKKSLAAPVIEYVTDSEDWLLTKRVAGEDCTYAKYLDDPKRLCDTIATLLRQLHEADFSDCPIDRVKSYIDTVETNYRKGLFDNSITDATCKIEKEDAYRIACENKHLLTNEVLLHGDYCLPNIMLDDWKFSGFVDLGNGGVGDRHIDLFWGAWTLKYNLRTDCYRERFFDSYGRDKIETDKFRIIAAMECFG